MNHVRKIFAADEKAQIYKCLSYANPFGFSFAGNPDKQRQSQSQLPHPPTSNKNKKILLRSVAVISGTSAFDLCNFAVLRFIFINYTILLSVYLSYDSYSSNFPHPSTAIVTGLVLCVRTVSGKRKCPPQQGVTGDLIKLRPKFAHGSNKSSAKCTA